MPSKMKIFTGRGPNEIIAYQIYCSDYVCLKQDHNLFLVGMVGSSGQGMNIYKAQNI